MVALKKVSYEESRQKRLEENKKRMDELKLNSLALSLRIIKNPKPSPMKKVNRTPRKPVDLSCVRRSIRVADKPPPSYKEVPIESLGMRKRNGNGIKARDLSNRRFASDEEREYAKERAEELHSSLQPDFHYRNGNGIKARDLSNRRFASDEEREYAKERAEELHSSLQPDFPSFLKPMLISHVSGGFWLGLPVDFCKSHLPKGDEMMTLVDEDGDEWQTKYLPRKTGLSGGWKAFAEDHKLVDGDALVFQLVKPTVFKVYITRVNQAEESDDA